MKHSVMKAMILVSTLFIISLVYHFNLVLESVPHPKKFTHTIENFSSYGYILATHFSDQLTAGSINMMSLQCWASSLNSRVKVVLPFLREGSHFGFEPSLLRGVTSQRKGPNLFDIVDAEIWSHFTYGRGYSALATWEEFLNNAPKKIILVDHGCERVTQSFLDYAMKFVEKNGFEVLRRVCTTTKRKLLTSEEYKRLIYDGHKPNETVVLFKMWGGVTSSLNRLTFREGPISDLHSCDLEHEQILYYIPPSRRIKQNGKKYIDKYLKSEKEYIGIMLRMEKLFIHHNVYSDADKIRVGMKCINIILNEVTKWKSRGFREIFLAMDTGKYGSSHFRRNHIASSDKLSKELFNRLYRDTSLSYSEWEESFNSVADFSEAGYIGAVQQYVAANAKVLLLAGGGTFQDKTKEIHDRIYLHSDNEAYYVKNC